MQNDDVVINGSQSSLPQELRTCLKDNQNALKLLDILENDTEIRGLLTQGNSLAINRLNYNDHGIVHSRLASLNALTILRILHERGINTTIEEEKWGNYEDSQVVVLGATYLHDIGNSIHRQHHHEFALILVNPILREILPTIYSGEKLHRIRASILECIFSHDESAQCLSIEGGCVTVGDGADMANGRARIPFSRGKIDIHSVSALSIKAVRIVPGTEKPVRIEVIMTESAGVFQIQNVLGKKIEVSGLRDHIEVRGRVVSGDEDIVDEIVF